MIPYVCDQLAMARLARATYALLVALLPATATAIGVIVLAQMPTASRSAGVALVVGGVAVHRERSTSAASTTTGGPSSFSVAETVDVQNRPQRAIAMTVRFVVSIPAA